MTIVGPRYAGVMPQGPRIERVGEEFREILAEEIPKLKDPRIGFVTVTGVKVTGDLRRAWVYYTALGDDKERASTRAGLRSAVPRLRGVIGKQVRMKFLPELAFEEDATLEQAAKIDRLITRLNAEGEPGGDAEEGFDG
ncbi:MAG: 30S ribosome-binding factor RbfA [Actinomycetota bacterium]